MITVTIDVIFIKCPDMARKCTFMAIKKPRDYGAWNDLKRFDFRLSGLDETRTRDLLRDRQAF